MTLNRSPANTRGGKKKSVSPNPGRLDAANLAGITSLMNPQNIRPDVDLESAEKRAMGVAGKSFARGKRERIDPIRLYTKELREIASEVGIDFFGVDGDGDGDADPSAGDDDLAPAGGLSPTPRPKPAAKPKNLLGGTEIDSLIGDLDLGIDSETEYYSGESESDASGSEEYYSDGSGSEVSGPAESGSEESGSEERGSDDESGSESGESTDGGDDDDGDGDDGVAALESQLGIDRRAIRRSSQRRHRVHAVSGLPSRRGSGRLRHITEEQERRQHINSVMGGMRRETRTHYGAEHERQQDSKT